MSNEAVDSEQIYTLTGLSSAINCAEAAKQLAGAERAKQLAEKIEWTNGLLVANKKCGNIYFECLNNYAKALDYFLDNATIAGKNEDITGEALALESVAKCHERLGRHKKALGYLDQALQLHASDDIDIGLTGDIGLTYNVIGDYTAALSAYVNSLALLDKSVAKRKRPDIQDTLQRAGLLMNIGDIYQSMSQPDKALENYTHALAISRIIKDKHLELYAQIGIGYTYRVKKDYKRAIETYNEALYSCHDQENYKDQASIMTDLALAYLETRQSSLAQEQASGALLLAQNNHYNDILPRCYAVLGKVALAQNDYNKAVNYLEQALHIYHTKGELDEEKDTWEGLSAAYDKMGKPALSLNAYRHFIAIRDSIYNVQKANELTRIDLEFRYSRKQLADSLKQAAVYEKKAERQRFITWGGYIGLAMVLLLMFFIYRNYITQKKYNLLLSKEKKRHLAHIEEQSNVLTDIAHTQSHNVRGPVATILGLVQLFNHEDLTDPVNKVVIDGVTSKTEELDKVIKEVITKENRLRRSTKAAPNS